MTVSELLHVCRGFDSNSNVYFMDDVLVMRPITKVMYDITTDPPTVVFDYDNPVAPFKKDT